MSNQQQRMHAWWQTRAPRARIMLKAMLAAVAAVVAWYAVVVPSRHWRSSAQARDDIAAETLLDARGVQRNRAVAVGRGCARSHHAAYTRGRHRHHQPRPWSHRWA
ncbi:type II secretion system protein M [Xanthomonas fragariae]|uniref:General secretion pathway, M protein n=1 Tax=Xanthomonas fragariae TaxID=48664 RepID=A0A1Y6HAT7_9XANT|nr:type II secretion system protein M [Xanthomonas fragariae LMG 25863]SMQ96730.1 type II secretion system protein M [Xanthomonas fragariae]SMR00625.1 General secretion pathway, M protein [Xanthomonas fragariae]SMR01925.1 type II secretion system protein M [Xanthomonas fragariae]